MSDTWTHMQFREDQHRLGLSDRQLAAMLGVHEQHIRRLKAKPGTGHHREVTATIARLMQAYLDGYRPDDWPAG